MNWFGIVNPAAGRHGTSLSEVVEIAEGLNIDATFAEARSVEHAEELIQLAIVGGHRRFVSVGGDGTAHLVVNCLMTSGCPDRFTLAIVATGSGSDFVRTFGHESGVHPGLSRLVLPETYSIDIGMASGSFGSRYFLNAMNLGVAAASATTAERLPRALGSIRYTTAFWFALWSFRSGPVEVTVGRRTFRGEAINIVIANGQFFGGGLNIAPRATLVDGKMDVQIFLAPRRQAFAIMPRVLTGTHLSHKGVRRFSGGAIQIDVPHGWPVEADGEIIGTGNVEVRVLPKALDFVI